MFLYNYIHSTSYYYYYNANMTILLSITYYFTIQTSFTNAILLINYNNNYGIFKYKFILPKFQYAYNVS